MEFDLAVVNGTVIDGSGEPKYRADVGIADGRIAAIGVLGTDRARSVIDAEGLIVAPGFIDAHTHDDRAILATPDMLPKISQGITTVIAGNCGISLAPLCHCAPPAPLDLIDDGQAYVHPTFSAYLQAVEARPPAVNAAFLIGHSTLRVAAMAGLDRQASADEITVMRKLLQEALDAGALGVSTGTFYPTAACATAQEIKEVCLPLRERGGILATHMRDETDRILSSIEETCDIGRYLGVKTIISHHKIAGRPNWGMSGQTLNLIARHMQEMDLGLDCYPYNATSTTLRPERVQLSSRVLITWSTPHPEMAGRYLSEVADRWGLGLEEAARQLVPGGATYFTMDEADVQRILRFDDTMIGSDGLPHDARPHPRLWGSFPRVLGHYCRELGLFSLEQAVRKMTGLTATQFGLADRGFVRPGMSADLTLFDAATVMDTATFDDPVSPAAGIHVVINNGERIWEGQRFTGRYPGKVLRYRPPETC